jgi:predicted amidohydrolase YtcJ
MKRSYVEILTSMLLLFALTRCTTKGVGADVVLVHGNIITAAKIGDRAQAMAIRDGKIIAVGSDEEIQKNIGDQTKTINLEGKTVVPGFNDAHLHPSPVYPFESPHFVVDVSPANVKNVDELVAVLKKKADITPAGLPVRGLGYQDTKLGGHPTRQILDRVSLTHPVIIRHSSGHISAVNSFVLQLAGITKNTKDPAGGAFDRDASGEPNGVIRENALSEFFRSNKMKSPEPAGEAEEMEGYRKCFANYMANGITSITEAGSSFPKMEIYEKLQKAGLPLRINLLMSEAYVDDVISKGIKQGYGNEKLRISGIKVFHGNSLSGRTCWLSEPYDMINPKTGKKDYYGIPPKRNQQALDSLFLKIHTHGLQIGCHSNGDREIDMVINSIERIQQLDPQSNRRHRIEHCSVTNANILKRIKDDSIVIVLHSYVYEHGDKMIVYGPERWKMMFPNRTAIDMGIAVAQHSDSPISAAIPMLRIQSLVTCTSSEGIVIGENQRISAEEAIRLWTYGGAYASFEDKIKGTLEVGKLADMVVLSEDPTKATANTLKDIKVIQTLIGGQVVYDDHKTLAKK